MISEHLLAFLRDQYRLDWKWILDVEHWAHVRANGLKLARIKGANTTVVELFAFLHDNIKVLHD